MTDKLREQSDRGAEAERLLSNPLIKEFFDRAEQAIVNTWMESDVQDETGQRMCKLALRAQQNLRDQFKVCIRNGEMATKELIKANDPTKPRR